MDLSKLPRLSKTDAPPPDAGGPDAPAPGAETLATSSAPAAGYCRCGAPLRAGARFCDSCGTPAPAAPAAADYAAAAPPRDAGIGAEVWLSAIIGVVLMLIGRSFGAWLLAKATGAEFHTGVNWTAGEKEGQEVAYWDLQGFTALSDSAIFLFGLAMVLEAAVLAALVTRFRHKTALVTVALLITLVATAYNLFACAKLLSANLMPLTSLLAVGFGGYIAVFEWRLLQQLKTVPR